MARCINCNRARTAATPSLHNTHASAGFIPKKPSLIAARRNLSRRTRHASAAARHLDVERDKRRMAQ